MDTDCSVILNPASVSIDIPITSLKDTLPNLLPQIRSVCHQTTTHIYASESPDAKVRCCIYGRWRNCYAAARLLWYRLTNPTTVHVHGSWAASLQQPGVDGKSLAALFHTEVNKVQGVNLVSLTGVYWDVMKLRRELVVRYRRATTATPFASTSRILDRNQNMRQMSQASHILNAIQYDLRRSAADCSFARLEPSDMLHLLFGAGSPDRGVSNIYSDVGVDGDLLSQSFESDDMAVLTGAVGQEEVSSEQEFPCDEEIDFPPLD